MKVLKVPLMFNVLAAMLLIGVACVATQASGRSAVGNASFYQEEPRPEGTWLGDSLCQVKNSPCHDEKAIYVVSKPDAAGNVSIDMGKIVDGKPETMGVLVFVYDRQSGTLTCDNRYGVWKLKFTGDNMEGTLTLHDGRLYRRISLKRAKS